MKAAPSLFFVPAVPILFGFLLGFSAAATAEIYRWIDRDGKPHYGDAAAKQPGEKAERLDIPTAAPTLDPEAEKTRRQLHEMDKFRQQQRQEEAHKEAQRAAQLQQQEQQRQKRCNAIRDAIRDDQETARVYRRDEDGNRIYLSSEQRTAYREQLQAQQQQYCGD